MKIWFSPISGKSFPRGQEYQVPAYRKRRARAGRFAKGVLTLTAADEWTYP